MLFALPQLSHIFNDIWSFLYFLPVLGFLNLLPTIGSMVGGLFGGGAPQFKMNPYSQQTLNQLDPFLSNLNTEINNAGPSLAQRYLKSGVKSLRRGEDFSKNPVAAPYLMMRSAEKATKARQIQRSAQDVAAHLPQGAEHLSAAIRQQLQNQQDQTDEIGDAVGVSNIISGIPQAFEGMKNANEARIGAMRGQYLGGLGLRDQVTNRGTYTQPSLFQRIMQGLGGGLSMLPAFMKPGGGAKVPPGGGAQIGSIFGAGGMGGF